MSKSPAHSAAKTKHAHRLANRMVLFTLSAGVVRPALVTRVVDEEAGTFALTVFCDPNVDGTTTKYVTACQEHDGAEDCVHTFHECGKSEAVGPDEPPAPVPEKPAE